MNQTVMLDKVVKDMYNLTTTGANAYMAFVEERIITRKVNAWYPIKRLKLQTWKSASESLAHKAGMNVICLLMSCCS